jgi:hypothetical protein
MPVIVRAIPAKRSQPVPRSSMMTSPRAIAKLRSRRFCVHSHLSTTADPIRHPLGVIRYGL